MTTDTDNLGSLTIRQFGSNLTQTQWDCMTKWLVSAYEDIRTNIINGEWLACDICTEFHSPDEYDECQESKGE